MVLAIAWMKDLEQAQTPLTHKHLGENCLKRLGLLFSVGQFIFKLELVVFDGAMVFIGAHTRIVPILIATSL